MTTPLRDTVKEAHEHSAAHAAIVRACSIFSAATGSVLDQESVAAGLEALIVAGWQISPPAETSDPSPLHDSALVVLAAWEKLDGWNAEFDFDRESLPVFLFSAMDRLARSVSDR